LIAKKKKQRAASWENKKQRQKDAGLTNEQMVEFESLVEKVNSIMSQNQRVNFSILVMKETKGMNLKDGTAHQIKRYKEKLDELKASSE